MRIFSAQCKDCIYYKQNMEGSRETCEKSGMLDTNDSCPMFLLNFHNVDIMKGREEKLYRILNRTELTKLKTFSILAQQEIITRQNGFSIGQVYWAKVFSPKYLSSYFKVVILGATKSHVYVQSQLRGKTWYGQLLKSSLLTEEEWAKIKDKIPAKDPNWSKYFRYVKPTNTGLKIENNKRGRKKKEDVEKTKMLDKMADDLLKHSTNNNEFFNVADDVEITKEDRSVVMDNAIRTRKKNKRSNIELNLSDFVPNFEDEEDFPPFD